MTRDQEDKRYAMRRLECMRDKAVSGYDQEAIDHADEVLRLIGKVPSFYFRGFGDFRGPNK